MLIADSRAVKTLIEAQEEEVPGRAGESKPEQSSSQAPDLGPGHRLVRRLALLLVSSGARLVQAGLPPRRSTGVGTGKDADGRSSGRG